jgi:uncharacterized coiled-coil DUF342 family protein
MPMKQTTIQALTALEEAIKERNTLMRYIDQYRTEYRRVRLKVKEWKHQVRQLNQQITELSKQGEQNGQKVQT